MAWALLWGLTAFLRGAVGRCLLRVAELPASVFSCPYETPPSPPLQTLCPLHASLLTPGSTLQSLSGALLGGGVFSP